MPAIIILEFANGNVMEHWMGGEHSAHYFALPISHKDQSISWMIFERQPSSLGMFEGKRVYRFLKGEF